MTDPASEAPSWVPPVGEALGDERARLLVSWIREHARPVVADAERALRDRSPGVEVQTDMCRVSR